MESLHTEDVEAEHLILQGKQIRLKPLDRHHAQGLAAASAGDAVLYQWSPVPQSVPEAERYIETALAWREAGTAVPFAIVRLAEVGRFGSGTTSSAPGETVGEKDGAIIGSTRFWNIEHWAWPAGHPRHGRTHPDACEIGYTWLASSALRTAVNTEAKLLMLTYAFETWQMLRVCFHTDVRNLRSRAALERIGGKFEGILRSHRMAADFIARDSARFSILASEWPDVKQRLLNLSNSRR
jgi:RimJ/RimL family protein N-acetyltransferase